ncbi:MAG: hypothetical protein HDT11_00215 [Helicobacter sp.]|nr:hypothetical protein [Helicobacter sp.]
MEYKTSLDEANKLTIKIENNNLKISELFETLQSVEREIKKQTYGQSEIFIREVRKGSMIFELIQIIAVNSLPFMENANVIVSFIENLNKYKNALIASTQNNPQNLDEDIVKNINGIGNVVSSPNASISIYNDFSNATFNLNFDETRILKENSLKYLPNKLEEKTNSDFVKNALIYFVQTNIQSKKADKAICEKISKRPIKVLIENENIRKEILQNPYHYNFAVDMEVQYRANKPILYVVSQLKEKWENED